MIVSRRNFIKLGAAGALLATASPILSQEFRPKQSLYCPVLMYHYISDAPQDAPATLVDLTVPPEKFASHLDILLENGFTTVTMADVNAAWQGFIELPEKPIVITFDDGYWDAYAHATPQLLQRGMRGTFFIITSFVDQPGYLTWGQAAEMRAAGMEIGNHSVSHPDMSRLSSDEQRYEVEASTQAFAERLGFHPTTFCYPLGRQNRITRLLLLEYGYETGLTTRDGTMLYQSNPYRLGRVRVRNSTTPETLLWLVNRRV